MKKIIVLLTAIFLLAGCSFKAPHNDLDNQNYEAGEILHTQRSDLILNTAAGGFSNSSGTYTSTAPGSLSYCSNQQCANGTLEVTVTAPSKSDNGLIFCLDRENKTSFWEDVNYYMFFVNQEGYAYLGKVFNGRWNAIKAIKMSGWSYSNPYKLRVVLNGTTVHAYVNDKLYIIFSEYNFLTGREFGIRAAVSNAQFASISYNDSCIYD